MSRRDVGYATLAMRGVAVVAFGSSSSEHWSLGGDLAAIGALFGWSAYFIATRHAQTKVTTQQYTVCVAIYVGLLNVPLAALFGQDLSWPTGESWMWLVIMAFGSGILGHTAMNWSLRHVPLWLASTLTLGIPVVASGLAWLVFGEALSVLQMVAMGWVVVALGMIVRKPVTAPDRRGSRGRVRTGHDCEPGRSRGLAQRSLSPAGRGGPCGPACRGRCSAAASATASRCRHR